MKLGKIIEQIRGVSYKPKDLCLKGEGIPLLRANNIFNGSLVFDDIQYVKKECVADNQFLKCGDILICTSSGSKDLVGKAASYYQTNDELMTYGAFCKVIRVKNNPNINSEFIHLFFQSPQYKNQILHASRGANINNLKAEDFDNISIPVPSSEKQYQIVSELTSLVKLINTHIKHISLLNELLTSRFIEMFGDNQGDTPFDDVVEDNTRFGHKFDSSFYNDVGPIAIVDQGKNLICGYKNLEEDKEPYSDECIVFGDHTEVFKYIRFPFYLGADGTKILKVKSDWNTRFVFEYLNIFYERIGGYSRHFKFLREQKFIKPRLDEQIRFAEFANSIDDLKNQVEKRIILLNEILNKKMDEYFGGEE